MSYKILGSIKVLLVLVYNILLTPIANSMAGIIAGDKTPPLSLLYFFLFMMFVPEIMLLVSSGFREWIKNGLEDGDGKLDKSDFKEMIGHYSALWCLRMFVLFGLIMIFFQYEVDIKYYILPFLGAMGIEGSILLKNIKKIKDGTKEVL